GAGGRTEPAPEGLPLLGPELAPAHAGRAWQGGDLMALLEVSGLEVFFDLPDGELHAVQGVDLALEPHDRLGLVGESGSGKTTTVLALMGLLPPSASVAGSVRLDGRDLLTHGEKGADEWRWS